MNKRPHSPINKELLYMDNVDNFIKTIGITPKLKFDEIVVNNEGAMQIIDMIFRRYKKLGRDEQGVELMRELRKVFFPSVSDEEGIIVEENGKFNRNSSKITLDKSNLSPRNPRIANNSV
jgi:hypothetical protein